VLHLHRLLLVLPHHRLIFGRGDVLARRLVLGARVSIVRDGLGLLAIFYSSGALGRETISASALTS
jgi:hypothetical protein